ncbi:hypothetical protein [Micromonospora profundi]|uniref:hypothetical protein n=1 Tax=Micromonospora profundi TaxID=1420889 RepID=UPI0036A31263
MPEEAGIGATPQSRAQAGPERTRSMLSPGDDEHLCGRVGADSERGNQLRYELAGQLDEYRFVGFDLVVELLPPAGDRAQGVLCRGEHGGDWTGTQAGAPLDQGHLRQGL